MSAGLHVDTINLHDKRVAKQERPDSKVERKKREQEREKDDFTASCLFSADKIKRNNCKDRKTMWCEDTITEASGRADSLN